MLKSEIAGSYGSSIFNFLRKLHTVFYSGCTNLHSYQQCGRVSFSLHIHQHLLFVVFLMITILTNGRWYIVVLLICILVMLSIFSCACWPSVCHLWKNVDSDHLPILKFFVKILSCISCSWVSLIVHLVKNLPAMPETLVSSLGQEDLLEKG